MSTQAIVAYDDTQQVTVLGVVTGSWDRLDRASVNLPAHGWRLTTTRDGVVVTGLTRGGPADLSGIRLRDRVTEVDGAPIVFARDIAAAIYEAWYAPVQLTLQRSGREIRIELSSDWDFASRDSIGLAVI